MGDIGDVASQMLCQEWQLQVSNQLHYCFIDNLYLYSIQVLSAHHMKQVTAVNKQVCNVLCLANKYLAEICK